MTPRPLSPQHRPQHRPRHHRSRTLRDAALPPGISPRGWRPRQRLTPGGPVVWQAARWAVEDLVRLMEELRPPSPPPGPAWSRRALGAWNGAVAAFLDPLSPERRELLPALERLCQLSPEGLAAGLEAVLGGVSGEPAAELFAEADRLRAVAEEAPEPHGSGARGGGPALVVLAGNLPALAVQPLLPALALGRPVVLKSPSAEPLFAPAFVRALTARLPELAPSIAAVTWPGGSEALEAPLLAAAGSAVVYGGGEAAEALTRLAKGVGGPAPVVYGPKTSLALVGREALAEGVAASPGGWIDGLARDIALFDQRGCLSVAAIYAEASEEAARPFADALGDALERGARRWPPGPLEASTAAAVQQLRARADLLGLHRPELPLEAGTVIVDPDPTFQPTPGLRTVRIHPVASLAAVPRHLAPWRGRLQGAALTGATGEDLRRALEALGISRITPAGELQSPDALWHNGGIPPLAALATRLAPDDHRR